MSNPSSQEVSVPANDVGVRCYGKARFSPNVKIIYWLLLVYFGPRSSRSSRPHGIGRRGKTGALEIILFGRRNIPRRFEWTDPNALSTLTVLPPADGGQGRDQHRGASQLEEFSATDSFHLASIFIYAELYARDIALILSNIDYHMHVRYFAFPRGAIREKMNYLIVYLFMTTRSSRLRGFRTLAAMAVLGAMTAHGDTIGFFYALDADLQGLKSQTMEIGQSVKVGTRSIQRLRLGPHAIYAVRMGSGAVETAASAQALLARFRCDWAFSLGPAGALIDNLETNRWYRVDHATAWQRGSAESIWNTDWSRFPVVPLPSPLETPSTISVTSGEQFISTASERKQLQTETQADAVDMNMFGLALVCADHGVPLFSWKIISDRADENASETFRAFVDGYSGEGGQALANIIRALPANPNDPSSYPAIERLIRPSPADPPSLLAPDIP